MQNYQETLIAIRKELMKPKIYAAEIKPILENFNKSIADVQKLITVEQTKIAKTLIPTIEELDKIKALLVKNVCCANLSILENSKTDFSSYTPAALMPTNNDVFIDKLATEIVSRINNLTTIIIDLKTKEN